MGSLNPTARSTSGYGAAAAPARQIESPLAPKRTGYGLPCVSCKTYYAADLPACPVCHNPQRVSPAEPLVSFSPAEQLPDPVQLEQERERFLEEFSAQVIAAPMPPETATAPTTCTRQENHIGSPEPATVCQSCFDHLQERVDILEAAMHLEIREAAQIVYDAVWADPSDPNKTYQNAAQALLSELRRRSGIMPIFGQLQPPTN
jgi:hypothetical protein